MKLLLFVPEIILIFVLLNRQFVQDRIYCNKLYWMFLRKDISEETLKAGLKLTTLKGKIL